MSILTHRTAPYAISILLLAIAGWTAGRDVWPIQRAQVLVSRPTADVERIADFYRQGLGFELLRKFHDPLGHQGMVLGHGGAGFQLEFVERSAADNKAPSQEHLLVFYLPDPVEWQDAVDRMKLLHYEPVPSANPYWDINGKTFEDPDGYRVVLLNMHGR